MGLQINALAVDNITLIDTADSRLSDARQCDNTFANAATARTNLDVYDKATVDGKTVGLLEFIGGYSASDNVPDLDTSPSGISKGDTYAVTSAGDFFTEAVEIGDVLIAQQDNPTTLAHWVVVQKNMTASSVKSLYESNSDTNAFTDADHSKLDGIEDSATADQTGAEIKTAYEAEADTNAYTDAEKSKLAGIEAAATADQTGAEIKTAYEAEADTNAFTDADHSKLDGIEAGATADQTGAEIKTAYEAEADTNAFTDADHSKLDGIEAGATADQTGAEIKTAYEAEADTNAYTDAAKTKVDYLTVTEARNLDTMATDIAAKIAASSMRAGEVAAGSFAGDPMKYAVDFTTDMAADTYAVILTCETQNNDSFLPTIELKATTGFTINMNTADLTNLISVSWIVMAANNA